MPAAQVMNTNGTDSQDPHIDDKKPTIWYFFVLFGFLVLGLFVSLGVFCCPCFKRRAHISKNRWDKLTIKWRSKQKSGEKKSRRLQNKECLQVKHRKDNSADSQSALSALEERCARDLAYRKCKRFVTKDLITVHSSQVGNIAEQNEAESVKDEREPCKTTPHMERVDEELFSDQLRSRKTIVSDDEGNLPSFSEDDATHEMTQIPQLCSETCSNMFPCEKMDLGILFRKQIGQTVSNYRVHAMIQENREQRVIPLENSQELSVSLSSETQYKTPFLEETERKEIFSVEGGKPIDLVSDEKISRDSIEKKDAVQNASENTRDEFTEQMERQIAVVVPNQFPKK